MDIEFLEHCENDNQEGVKECLKYFCEILCKGLIVACKAGNSTIVSSVLEMPRPDINFQDEDGDTAIYLAIDEEQTECVRTLAETGKVQWNKRDIWGHTPLYYALGRSYSDIVDIIMQQPNIDYTVQTEMGDTLGHAAVTGGSVECVEKLIAQERFHSWNVPDGPLMGQGDTPIMLALKLCNTEIVEILIRCPQVDLSCRDREGWSLVFRAIQRNELGKKMLKIFENHSLSL